MREELLPAFVIYTAACISGGQYMQTALVIPLFNGYNDRRTPQQMRVD